MPLGSRLTDELIKQLYNKPSQANVDPIYREVDVLIAGSGPVGYAFQNDESSKYDILGPVLPMRVSSSTIAQMRV